MRGELRARPGLNALRPGKHSLRANIVWWVGLSVCGWSGLALGWSMLLQLF